MTKFLGVEVKPGETVRKRVHVADFADGTPVTIPVAIVGGVKPGPTLYVQAGIHGDELTGIEICRMFLKTLDPNEISGTVVAVPVANLPSHLTRTRGFLNEERLMIDMNRIWPGNPGGLLTERLADVLFNQFVVHSDFTVDLHSALDGCDIRPFAYIWPADDENGTLAARESAVGTFGVPIYRHARASKFGTSDVQRSLAIVADAAKVPMTLLEMGESRRVSRDVVPIGVRGLRNIMKSMGMLEGQPEPNDRTREFTHFAVVHATRGGGLRMLVELDDEVKAGDPVAEIVDTFGDTVETVVAPEDGFILRVMRFGSVATGAELVWVAN